MLVKGRIAQVVLVSLVPALLVGYGALDGGWQAVLPEAEAHAGTIHVTRAALTGPNTIVITYSGVVGAPEQTRPTVQCFYGGCIRTGTV